MSAPTHFKLIIWQNICLPFNFAFSSTTLTCEDFKTTAN